MEREGDGHHQEKMQRFKVLVTGGLGFVGSAIVRACCDQHPEWDICILDKQMVRPKLGLGRDVARLSAQGALDDKNEGMASDDEILDKSYLVRNCTFSYICADITNEEQVNSAFHKIQPDIVVHAAGMIPALSERYHRRLEAEVHDVNVQGTKHVVKAARDHGCRALVYTSSCTVVTDDLGHKFANIDETWPVSQRSSIYGESKVKAEKIVLTANGGAREGSRCCRQDLGKETRGGRRGRSMGDMDEMDGKGDGGRRPLSTCVLRPAVIFGEGDNQLIPSIHECIGRRQTRYRLGDGSNLWDTVYVGNVADAHILAIEKLVCGEPRIEDDCKGEGQVTHGRVAGEVFFVQNNEPISFREFSVAVWKEFGHIPPRLEICIPEGLGWILGLISEVVKRVSGQATILCRGTVMDACATRYASGGKAREVLGYVPQVSLEDGLKKSCSVSAPLVQGPEARTQR